MDKPVYKLRRERLTFKNPSKDFMKKLIMGGGTIMVGDIHHIRKFTFSARISLLFSLLRRAATRWRVIRLSEIIFETTLLFDLYGIFRKSLVRDSSFPLSLFVPQLSGLFVCLPSSNLCKETETGTEAFSLGKLQSVSNQSYNYIYWLINCTAAAIQLEFLQSHTHRKSVVLCQLVRRLTCSPVRSWQFSVTRDRGDDHDCSSKLMKQQLPLPKVDTSLVQPYFLRQFMQ